MRWMKTVARQLRVPSRGNPPALSVSVPVDKMASWTRRADSEDGVVVLITIGGSGTSAGMVFSTDGGQLVTSSTLVVVRIPSRNGCERLWFYGE